jgi:hypothetical protein
MYDSTTPIFQLLDDIDEPGSLSSVAISKDGSFVTAGGKAVHAREFGNGGQVYAIRIIEQLSNDVGVKAINSPGNFLQVGQSKIIHHRLLLPIQILSGLSSTGYQIHQAHLMLG